MSSATQNQAFNAILLLYGQVLEISLDDQKISAVRAGRKKNMPVVLTQEEVSQVLILMNGTVQLMAKLLYGSGLRVMECVRLRVQDIDFGMGEITVREGKGFKDRLTILPESLAPALQEQIERVKVLHRQDLKNGFGSVYMPYGLERKFRNAHKELGWQFLFPASDIAVDPSTGLKRRHHMHESNLQRSVKRAARQAGINKRVTPHTLRHSFATICSWMVRISERSRNCWSQGCINYNDLYPCPAAEGNSAGAEPTGLLRYLPGSGSRPKHKKCIGILLPILLVFPVHF